MSENARVCWKCGHSVHDIELIRRAECAHCRADLHVCRMCRFFDPGLRRGCLEPIAEDVSDRERANFCDYFSVQTNVYVAAGGAGEEAKRALDELFGIQPGQEEESASDDPNAKAQQARRRLDELFDKKDPQ